MTTAKLNNDYNNNLKKESSRFLKKLEERRIAKVSNRQFVGRDEQVDNRAVVLEPGHWEDYDPFLLMAEDWFSTQGFD